MGVRRGRRRAAGGAAGGAGGGVLQEDPQRRPALAEGRQRLSDRLDDAPRPGAARELSRLKAKVKQPTARKMIDKALGASAAAAGMTTDDLEELAVPTYGLTEIGRCEQKIGSFTAELKIEAGDVELNFIDAKGKSRSSVPAELKKDFPQPLKELQQRFKDLTKMLPAQRDRLERMPMNRRELPYAAWRERYLDHPVVGTLARRLIWDFGDHRRRRRG